MTTERTARDFFEACETGPAAPTENSAASDHVDDITFDGDETSHLTKVRNDLHALRALGWA